MSDATTGEVSTGQEESTSERDLLQQASRALDAWRSKIDELMVQLDLANLDVREEIRTRLDTTQNAYLAARSRLAELGHDSGSGLTAVRQGIEKLLGDVRQAFESAEAVIRRSKTSE